MLGKQMPGGTLYLIFEEDFRFEDDYDVVGERLVLQIKMDKSAYRSKTDLPPVVATSSAANKKLKGKCYEIPTKLPGAAHEPAAMPQYLLDVVRLLLEGTLQLNSRRCCGQRQSREQVTLEESLPPLALEEVYSTFATIESAPFSVTSRAWRALESVGCDL